MNAKELASPTGTLDKLKERERRARLFMAKLYRTAPDGHDIRSLRGVANRLFNWIDSRNKSTKSVSSLAELGEKRKQLAEARAKLSNAMHKRRVHQTVIAKVDALSKRIAQIEQTLAEIDAEETILRIYHLGHIRLAEIAEVYRTKTPHLPDLAILIAAYHQLHPTEETTSAHISMNEIGSGEDLVGAPNAPTDEEREQSMSFEHESSSADANNVIVSNIELTNLRHNEILTALSKIQDCSATFDAEQKAKYPSQYASLRLPSSSVIGEINDSFRGTPLYLLYRTTEAGTINRLELVYSEGNGKPFRIIRSILFKRSANDPQNTYTAYVTLHEPKAEKVRALQTTKSIPELKSFKVNGRSFSIEANDRVASLLSLLPAGQQYILNAFRAQNEKLRLMNSFELHSVLLEVNAAFEKAKVDLELVNEGSIYKLIYVDRTLPPDLRRGVALAKEAKPESPTNTWVPTLPIFDHTSFDQFSAVDERLIRSRIELLLKEPRFAFSPSNFSNATVYSYQLPHVFKEFTKREVPLAEALTLVYLHTHGQSYSVEKRNATLALVHMMLEERKTFNS